MQGAKKKYTQNDLRRLMSEHKAKAAPKVAQHKIDSPLAKYPLQYNQNQMFTLFIHSFANYGCRSTKMATHFP